MEQEIWKPVVGWEGFYEVSNMGRARSIDRYVRVCRNGKMFKKKVKGIILTEIIDIHGYPFVHLRDAENNKGKCVKIHKLVALSFIDNPNNYKCIDHINGIRNDNRVENLRWCSHSQNNNFDLAKKNRRKGILQFYENNPDKKIEQGVRLGRANCKPIDVWKNNLFIGHFEGLIDFCRKFNFRKESVGNSVRKNGKYKGFTIKYTKK